MQTEVFPPGGVPGPGGVLMQLIRRAINHGAFLAYPRPLGAFGGRRDISGVLFPENGERGPALPPGPAH